MDILPLTPQDKSKTQSVFQLWPAYNECFCRLLVHKNVIVNNVTMNRTMNAAVHAYDGVAVSEPVNANWVRDALVFKAISEQQPTLWSSSNCLIVSQLWNRS